MKPQEHKDLFQFFRAVAPFIEPDFSFCIDNAGSGDPVPDLVFRWRGASRVVRIEAKVVARGRFTVQASQLRHWAVKQSAKGTTPRWWLFFRASNEAERFALVSHNEVLPSLRAERRGLLDKARSKVGSAKEDELWKMIRKNKITPGKVKFSWNWVTEDALWKLFWSRAGDPVLWQ